MRDCWLFFMSAPGGRAGEKWRRVELRRALRWALWWASCVKVRRGVGMSELLDEIITSAID